MRQMVSVVLAVYNGERFLRDQVESILGQTYPDIEIVIVDDVSEDSSYSIATEMAAKDRRIKVFRNERNLGVVPNFLKAVSLSAGQFVCFADQDDHWRSNKVAVLLDLLKEDPRNTLAYSDLEICDENLEPLYPSFWRFAGIRPLRGRIDEKIFLRNIAPGCSMMVRGNVKEALLKMPPNPPLMHDHMTFILASGLGRIVYTREKLLKYRQHSGNNIGAFHQGDFTREHFIRDLEGRISYFKRIPFEKPLFNLGRLERFTRIFERRGLLSRTAFMNYFLFLRDDRLPDKILGGAECLFPTIYACLHSIKEGREPMKPARKG